MFKSKLFNSTTVNGKKEFLKNICLIFKREMLSVFLKLHAFLSLEFEYFDGVVEFSMVALILKGF